MKAKKFLSILLAMGALMVALTACNDKKEPNPSEETNEESSVVEEQNEQFDGMPNPMVEYDTVEDAVITVGHLSPLPQIYERYDKKVFVISGKLLEIIYLNDSGEVLTLREQAGESGDISGVYNEYPYNKVVEIAGNPVSVRGASGDSIVLATWYDGAYNHSLFYISIPNFSLRYIVIHISISRFLFLNSIL